MRLPGKNTLARHSCLLIASTFLWVFGTGGNGSAATEAKDRPEPVPDAVNIDLLTFDPPELQDHFRCLDTAARGFVDQGFVVRPYQQGGNFVKSIWAKGIGFTEPSILGGSRESLTRIHRISINAVVVPFPRAKAAGLDVEVVTSDPQDWSVSFWHRKGTRQQVAGSGWGITLYRWNPDRFESVKPFRPFEEFKERLLLPVSGYDSGTIELQIRSERHTEDGMVEHLRSAEALRDATLADLARLEAKVVSVIRDHKAEKKVQGEYSGRGVPPPFHWEPLTREEETLELAKANEFFAAQTKLVREQYEAMYAALRSSFPFERVWPEIGAK